MYFKFCEIFLCLSIGRLVNLVYIDLMSKLSLCLFFYVYGFFFNLCKRSPDVLTCTRLTVLKRGVNVFARVLFDLFGVLLIPDRPHGNIGLMCAWVDCRICVLCQVWLWFVFVFIYLNNLLLNFILAFYVLLPSINVESLFCWCWYQYPWRQFLHICLRK